MWSIASLSYTHHKMEVQQIGVQISEEFKLPKGQTSFNYRDLNKKITFILDTNLTQGHLPSHLFLSHPFSWREKNKSHTALFGGFFCFLVRACREISVLAIPTCTHLSETGLFCCHFTPSKYLNLQKVHPSRRLQFWARPR